MDDSRSLRVALGACLVAALVGLSAAPALQAQSTQTIVGTVRDQSGGAVPGATVTVKHLETNEARETLTNDQGDYRVQFGRVGKYEVTGQLGGFKRALVTVLLTTGQTARVDLSLQVGDVAQSVTVEGTVAPLVQSETSSLRSVMENQQILELPLNGRDFLQLTALQPGVATKSLTGAGYNEYGLSVNGMRSRDNDFRLDGIRVMASYNNNMTTRPPLDAIEEFQMVRNNFSAEYGRAMGGVIEVRTKTGTNNFHGSAYEFARRGSWAAIPYFALTRPTFKTDQYGGSFGGPIWIPGLYKGTNKSFFFFAYEGYDSPSQVTRQFYAPTDADRAGDFNGSIYPAPRDPLTGQPFPNRIIPQSRWSIPAQNILKILPKPNQTIAGDVNWTGNFPANSNNDSYVLRLDQQFNPRHSLFFSGTMVRKLAINADRLDCGSCANRISDENFPTDQLSATLGYTWVVNPRIVIESRNGFTMSDATQDIRVKENFSKQFGFDFFPQDGAGHLFGPPRINVGRFAWLGTTNSPYTIEQYLADTVNTVSITQGSHAIKAGVDMAQDRLRSIGGYGSRGAYFVTDRFTGNQVADFLLGHYNSANFQLSPAWYKAKRPQYAWFVHDDWKASRRLTLNIGLRYDYVGPYDSWEGHRLHRFDLRKNQVVYPAALEPLISADTKSKMKFSYRFEGPSTSFDGDKNDFGPRFGFAFRPFATGDLVVRGGYGLMYNSPMGLETIRAGRIAPWDAYLAFTPSTANPFTFQNADQSLKDRVFASPGFMAPVEPGFKNAYTQHWNFTVQKSLMQGTALEVSYAGSRSVNMTFQRDADVFGPTYGFDTYFTRVLMTVNGFDARYDSMQVQLQQRMRYGMTYRANYTWSKLMNDTADYFDNGTVNILFKKEREWGPGFNDRRHAFNLSGILELPFGHGQAFLTNLHPVAEAILGGWRTNFIFDTFTGYPMNVLSVTGYRPDMAPGKNANLPSSQRNPDRWFDPAAFQNVSNATQCTTVVGGRQPGWNKIECTGNVGRNVLQGPGYWNLDLGISKYFKVYENHRIEFRGEFFNAFNHPNRTFNITNGAGIRFDLAGTTRLTSAYPSREIQLSLRYSF